MADTDVQLPATLTIDEAYRAAFYLVSAYIRLEKKPCSGLVLLRPYMRTDPAHWGDWLDAVRRALADGGLADPIHERGWRIRPDIPI
jgi:hypothetical protein